MCVRVFVRLCACAFVRVRAMHVCLCVALCACALMCAYALSVCACVGALVSACAWVRAFPSDCIFSRVGSTFACVRAAALCAPSHRTAATCGIHSSAHASRCGRVCGRAGVVAFGATGRARARRLQGSPGRAAPSRRNGFSDTGTRPWSTPPAPSTSSAATANCPASAACRTCG